MNIADDHKPFSHRVPPLLHLDCPVAATAAADRTDVRLRAGVAAHEPMISWFCGQFDGQSRRTLWQAIRPRSASSAVIVLGLTPVRVVDLDLGCRRGGVPDVAVGVSGPWWWGGGGICQPV